MTDRTRRDIARRLRGIAASAADLAYELNHAPEPKTRDDYYVMDDLDCLKNDVAACIRDIEEGRGK